MSSVNKVLLIGRLGRDPEVRYTAGGKAVCNFSIATSETFGRSQEKEESTEWHNLVAWEKNAENCGQYLKKGSQVYVEGRLATRKWQDKEGKERQTTEIVVKHIVFLTPSGQRQGASGKHPADDEDIPF